MTELPVEEKIVSQISEIQKSIMQAMLQLARTNHPQFTFVNRELGGLVSEVVKLKDDVQSQFSKYQKQVESQQKRVEALINVGSVINSTAGLNQVLEKVMDAIIALMDAERGFLMLKDESGNMSVQIARGIAQADLAKDSFAISKSIVKRVSESEETILTTNAQEDPRFDQQASVAAYHLLSILCAPLKVKDVLIGVIYVDNRAQTGIFDKDDFELISLFANQAAVAIENARLFDDLKTAYQATLEGWVRALDLRDKETEGHTQRVTSLTIRLAKTMGIDGDDLVHIQRGALLHDIGKMAIPDGILLKPGALSPEERTLIEKHPVYAYEMLSPIKFLQPALDIPYCHHEKWNGTGYPRGLEKEQIPLAARIFAIADVWDALVSDRPYRKGLHPSEVREKIASDSGSHFDPEVVKSFLALQDI